MQLDKKILELLSKDTLKDENISNSAKNYYDNSNKLNVRLLDLLKEKLKNEFETFIVSESMNQVRYNIFKYVNVFDNFSIENYNIVRFIKTTEEVDYNSFISRYELLCKEDFENIRSVISNYVETINYFQNMIEEVAKDITKEFNIELYKHGKLYIHTQVKLFSDSKIEKLLPVIYFYSPGLTGSFDYNLNGIKFPINEKCFVDKHSIKNEIKRTLNNYLKFINETAYKKYIESELDSISRKHIILSNLEDERISVNKLTMEKFICLNSKIKEVDFVKLKNLIYLKRGYNSLSVPLQGLLRKFNIINKQIDGGYDLNNLTISENIKINEINKLATTLERYLNQIEIIKSINTLEEMNKITVNNEKLNIYVNKVDEFVLNGNKITKYIYKNGKKKFSIAFKNNNKISVRKYWKFKNKIGE